MIESYPFFVTKNDESFRFEFIPEQTHEIICLDAKSDSTLDWSFANDRLEKLRAGSKKALIKLDLGLEEGFSFNDEFQFKSYILALNELNKTILENYQDVIEGVILYRGSLDLVSKCALDADTISDQMSLNLLETFPLAFCHNLAACNILGQLLHRLVSFLKDDVPSFIIFEDAELFNPLDRAILLSKERFDHIFVMASCPEFQYTTLDLGHGHSLLGYMSCKKEHEPEAISTAVLLPSDEFFNKYNYSTLVQFMNSCDRPYRLITEKIFNECWNEIEKVYYDASSIHPMTARMIKGFEASGGESVLL